MHWVEPKLVVEITFLTWTGDGLLRHTVYVGSQWKSADPRSPISLGARFGEINYFMPLDKTGVRIKKLWKIRKLFMKPATILFFCLLLTLQQVPAVHASDFSEILGVNHSIDKAAGDMQLLLNQARRVCVCARIASQ